MDEMERRLCAAVDALAPEMSRLSREIHRHPEEGFREFRAVRLLSERLSRRGFRLEKPLRDMPTALRASRRGARPGPAVGFVAEYDALPDLGHACGHNLIAASAFGAAAALAPFLRETGGSVWLFGTPAEESGNGKVSMLARGVFKPVDAVLMCHPESMFLVNTCSLALDAREFRFRGRASHAAATPYEGVNALDAMLQLFNAVGALRQQLKPEARVHGIITKGGTFPNIIPDLTEARFYIRARERAYLDEVTRKVEACARGAALATGCRLELSEFESSVDEVVNHPELSGLVEKHLRALGVRDIVPTDEVPGSTDFGNLSRRVPSAYFYFAAAPRGKDLHTREFAARAASPTAHRGLLTAVKAMALCGLELLRRPDLARGLSRRRA